MLFVLTPSSPTHKHIYFTCRFYWSINLGALISYTVVAYICQYGAGPDLGGEEWGFFVGYTIPSIMMGALSLCLFFLSVPYSL